MQVSGGAERVTLWFGQNLKSLKIVVSRIYPDAVPLLAASGVPVIELGNTWSKKLSRIFEAVWCFTCRGKLLHKASIVLYSGFYAPLAVKWQKRGLKIYYCHTIPRFAYDLYITSKKSLPWPLQGMFAVAMILYRWQYEKAIAQMDVFIVNSENVRRRVQRHIGLNTNVIHPPVVTTNFKFLGDKDYYLSTARLTSNKRVDIVVRAFCRMPERRLVVMSGGPELPHLKKLASGSKNIEFIGWQSEDQLRQWVGYSRAVIYIPLDEDFGMSPVEAMAAGKPVIGVAEGGLLETIIDGVTGILIEGQPTPDKVITAVQSLEATGANTMRSACENRAAAFDEKTFCEKIMAASGGILSSHALPTASQQST